MLAAFANMWREMLRMLVTALIDNGDDASATTVDRSTDRAVEMGPHIRLLRDRQCI